MKKLVFNILFFVILVMPFGVFALEYPSVKSENVIIYDVTDEKVLYELESDEVTSVASLTKIMTAIVAIENIEDLDREVVITYDILSTVSWEASVAGLEAWDKVTYRDLLYGLILPSGADAANALAILVGGELDDFIDMMNEKAEELGMEDTHFVNATGLDADEHYSSAADILKLLTYALKNETFKEIFTTDSYTMSNGLKVKSTLNLYNKSTDLNVSSILGSKTGFTDDAGYCISIYFKNTDHEIVIITLDAPYSNGKYYNMVDSVSLMNFVLDSYGYNVVAKKGEVIETIPVELSNINEYEVKLDEEVSVFLENEYDTEKLSVVYDGINELSYKNKKGERLGVIRVIYDEEVLFEKEVFLEEDIKINIFKLALKYKYYILGFAGVVILLKIVFKKKKKKKRIR